MIATFSLLRGLALLRRTTRALERIADAQHTLAKVAAEDYTMRTYHRKPKPTEFGTLDIAEVNKRWHAQREAEAGGVGWQEP